MAINKTQKRIVAIVIPVIVVLLGFSMIGSGHTTSWGDSSIVFNPVRYLAKHGHEWVFVAVLIGIFEFFWWKDRKNKTE